MFLRELWQSTTQYRLNLDRMEDGFSDDLKYQLHTTYKREYSMMNSLNLDPVCLYVEQYYSPLGRPAIHQAQILRSLILFVLLLNQTAAKTSLTSWVRDVLPHSPVFIALIGCRSADDLPPLGSYYDLMDRFWLGSKNRYSRDALFPAQKNSKKPKKEIGPDGKLVEEETVRAWDIVEQLLRDEKTNENKEAILQDLFFLIGVYPSVKEGLIPSENLTLSGDGTAVPSHSDPAGKRSMDSDPNDENCDRHYSDPDASWGWDSSKKDWYFGYSLYMLCFRNNTLKVELPLTMKFTEARRHDSLNFLYTLDDFSHHTLGLTPKNMCLDSAHDNLATYSLLEKWSINAFIDINGRSCSSDGAPDDITFDKQGRPLCRAGYQMCSSGNDPIKRARKYICPFRHGHVSHCPYINECSPSEYGRTIYLRRGRNLRFMTRIPRDSEEYKSIYSERTACERVNARVLNDYQLQFLRIRGVNHFSFWTMLIGICLHLDARYKAAA